MPAGGQGVATAARGRSTVRTRAPEHGAPSTCSTATRSRVTRTWLKACVSAGYQQIALAGRSEIAEIAVLCASQSPVEIVALVDLTNEPTFLGVPVIADLQSLKSVDAIIVTDMKAARDSADA